MPFAASAHSRQENNAGPRKATQAARHYLDPFLLLDAGNQTVTHRPIGSDMPILGLQACGLLDRCHMGDVVGIDGVLVRPRLVTLRLAQLALPLLLLRYIPQ